MEPISTITSSIALGASATAGKEPASAVVKDTYATLKALVRTRYPTVSLDQLERAPESKSRRAVVEEDLTNAGAGRDEELLAVACKLTQLVQQQTPDSITMSSVEPTRTNSASRHFSDGASDAKAWWAFIKYGFGALVIFCAFIYFREGWDGGNCSDVVKLFWSWNLAKVLGDKAPCPYRAPYSGSDWVFAAFFVLWPPLMFAAFSWMLMRVDRAGGFQVIAKVKSLVK